MGEIDLKSNQAIDFIKVMGSNKIKKLLNFLRSLSVGDIDLKSNQVIDFLRVMGSI
jgi:hypothetical protein